MTRRTRLGQPAVCLVICQFGEFPPWMNAFLLCCRYNPSVNFLIFTDQPKVPLTPSNVYFVRLAMREFNTIASQCLKAPIQLSTPYKVCDFKPLYGRLFESYLKKYDYWGYTDLDVIFGDLRGFLTTCRLGDFEVFTGRSEYLVGHFTLFKNNERMRRLYENSRDIPSLLQLDETLSFDECGKQWIRLMEGHTPDSRATCDSMTHVVRRLEAAQELSACFLPLVAEWPELRGNNWRLQWHEGRLWRVDHIREVMYVHFHRFKSASGYRRPNVASGDCALSISALGINGVNLSTYPKHSHL